jgi:ribonuclease P protein component
MPQSFPRAHRIRRRSEFQRVYEQGTKAHGRFMTLFVSPNSLACTRLGIAATRKIGGAVVRNRAKRRVREIFRSATVPGGLDLVVVARREVIDAEWQELRAEFHALLGRQRRQSRQRRAKDA